MDRIRDRDHVGRLPVRDRDELKRKEDIFDRQRLLNESWDAYTTRTEQHGRKSEEHEKWVTETWEEFEMRKHAQRAYLAAAEQKSEEDKRKQDLLAKARENTSNDTILRLMKFRDCASAKKLKASHHLYADFDEYQQIKFTRQQQLLQEEEEMLRAQISLWCDAEMHMYRELSGVSSETAQAFQHLRAHRQAILDLEAQESFARERVKSEEASDRVNIFNVEMEERLQEEAELRKRLERRQREEDKRMKARTQQEKRRSETEVHVPAEYPAPVQTKEEEPALIEEPAPARSPKEATLAPEKAPIPAIAFDSLEGDSVIQLFKSATKILSMAGGSSYIIRVDKRTREVMVVCQNGVFIGEKGTAPLLGKTIVTGDSISATSPKLHAVLSFDNVKSYAHSGCERILDVTTAENCVPFIGSEKQQEELLLFPVKRYTDSLSEFVLACSRDGASSVTESEYDGMSTLAFDLCTRYNAFAQKKINTGLCQQCVDWISVNTGCEAVYISLFDQPEVLTYVAATASHKFLLGKTHSSIDEKAKGGISHSLLSTRKPASFVTDDVGAPLAAPYDKNHVRFFTKEEEGERGEKHGALMAIAIAGSNGVVDESLGVLFLDFVGTKVKVNEVHKQIVTTACELLADLLLGRSSAPPAVQLKIEETCPEGASDFLKALWSKSIESLNAITPNQLLELAKYLRPPPVVPLVVQSTLLVVLGVKPQKVAAWEDARKRVTRELLTKMRNFDPTDLKARKKDFFIRAKKQLKGYTATDVFEKGSYPTQCFFSWVFTAILLRKQAEKIQQQGSAFLWEKERDDRESTYSADTTGMNIDEDDVENENDDESDGEDDDGENVAVDL